MLIEICIVCVCVCACVALIFIRQDNTCDITTHFPCSIAINQVSNSCLTINKEHEAKLMLNF